MRMRNLTWLRYFKNKIIGYKAVEKMDFRISIEILKSFFLLNSLKETWYNIYDNKYQQEEGACFNIF